MARSEAPVSYENVAEACTSLRVIDVKPTIRRVRQELGDRGSLTTIAAHLRAWLETESEKVSAIDVYDDELAGALEGFVRRREEKAKAAMQERLAALEDACGELQEALDRALAQSSDFEADVSALRREKADLEAHIERQRLAADARREFADRRDAEVSAEVRALRQDQMQAKEEAAKAAAVATAAFARAEAADAQLAALRNENSNLRAKTGAGETTLRALERDVANAQGSARSKDDTIAVLQAELRAARDECKTAREENKALSQEQREMLERELERAEIRAENSERMSESKLGFSQHPATSAVAETYVVPDPEHEQSGYSSEMASIGKPATAAERERQIELLTRAAELRDYPLRRGRQ
jgi:chromosome segregation ATPase